LTGKPSSIARLSIRKLYTEQMAIAARPRQTHRRAFASGCTVKDTSYDIALRKKLYRSVEELQTDLDAWPAKYNKQRSGR